MVSYKVAEKDGGILELSSEDGKDPALRFPGKQTSPLWRP